MTIRFLPEQPTWLGRIINHRQTISCTPLCYRGHTVKENHKQEHSLAKDDEICKYLHIIYGFSVNTLCSSLNSCFEFELIRSQPFWFVINQWKTEQGWIMYDCPSLPCPLFSLLPSCKFTAVHFYPIWCLVSHRYGPWFRHIKAITTLSVVVADGVGGVVVVMIPDDDTFTAVQFYHVWGCCCCCCWWSWWCRCCGGGDGV